MDTRTGIPTLRATDGPGKHLTLRADGPGRVLIRATQGDYRAARALLDGLGARLLDATPDEGEQVAWRQTRNELADEAPQWSTALRRIGLFLERMPDWSVRAPSAAETEVPADRIAARPHGPAVPVRVKATVAVTSWRGGEGRSTIAFALAEELARVGSSVLLLSADEFACQALQRRGVTPWPADSQTQGPERGMVAVAFWDERGDTVLVEQARKQADVVLLDTQFDYRPGTVAVDAEVAVSRYRDEHWQGHLVDDQRPRLIRVLEWFDEQFTHYRDAADGLVEPGERELRDLLAYLDDSFTAYVNGRARRGEANVYDRAVPADVDGFWAMDYELDYNRGEERLPAEDQQPLDEWRAQFLAFIDADGHERHPALWPLVARQWADRNRRRNLEHLQPRQPSAAELHHMIEEFLPTIADEATRRWGNDLADMNDLFRSAVIHRWLESTFTVFADLRAAASRDAFTTLLLVLDLRFAEYADRRLDPYPVLSGPAAGTAGSFGSSPGPGAAAVWRRGMDDGSNDAWWSADQALKSGAPMPEEDEGPLDAWRAEFMEQIDADGARRHPVLWERVRRVWAPRNRERNLADLAADELDAVELQPLMEEFAAAIAPVADSAWGPLWQDAAEAWTSGAASPLDSIGNYDDRVHLVPVDREPEETAALVEQELRHRSSPHAVTVLAVNAAPKSLAPQRVSAVSEALRTRGLAGTAVVPQSDALMSALFDAPGSVRSADGIANLARTLTQALARHRRHGA
ncbi:hypothetical protein ACIOGZ_28670 [Kitasatospora sp. NPDC088160]|uniref:hypothetical protein n=1 Tax=Kitasatospora sp. NPDC088160 TaxID=3364072 RepID=UPI0037F1FE80